MKLQISFILFLLANLFALNSMESISEDHFEAEDADMAQWFKQVNDFFHKNQNNSQQIDKLYEKTQEINEKLGEQHQQLMGLEGKVSTLLKEIVDLKQREENEKNSKRNIVIQRRQDGSLDFYRNWDEYKSGFGNETGEFFIGLEKLHELTNSRLYELLIIIEDIDLRRHYAQYDFFVVGNEDEHFILKSIGTYKGSAGDSLSYYVGNKFSTKDRDQDSTSSLNCAELYHGAWWYGSCQKRNTFDLGITWTGFRGTFKFVEMILVPKYSL